MWKRRYKVFSLSCKLMSAHEKWVVWLNRWECVFFSHHSTKFVDDKSCERKDITFLIRQVSSRDHLIKGHMTLWVGGRLPKSPLCQVWCLLGLVEVVICFCFSQWYHLATSSKEHATWWVKAHQILPCDIMWPYNKEGHVNK